MQMKFVRSGAKIKSKHGIKLAVYSDYKKMPYAGICYVEVKGGHYQEFYDDTSTYIYYILKGNGTFYLNGKENKVKATDALVIPPKTKIYYLGRIPCFWSMLLGGSMNMNIM